MGAARPKGKIFYRLEYDAYFTELHGKIKINKRELSCHRLEVSYYGSGVCMNWQVSAL